jgi:hypothetical protein
MSKVYKKGQKPMLHWIVGNKVFRDYDKALIEVNQRDLKENGIEND